MFANARVVRLRRPPPVLVCRKCLKRSDNGKAIMRALKDELKAQAKADAVADANGRGGETKTARSGGDKNVRKTKPAKLVMTSCFGLCPKNAVVTATAEQLAKGEVGLVGEVR